MKAETLTPMQAAERLGVSLKTIYLWIKTGKLPAVKIGPKLIRINESDLLKMVQEV